MEAILSSLLTWNTEGTNTALRIEICGNTSFIYELLYSKICNSELHLRSTVIKVIEGHVH